ncbi:translocation protein SEC62 [Enteropsectra breve]|nr:translocation protein SEC62 [Enteropsectra breve]
MTNTNVEKILKGIHCEEMVFKNTRRVKILKAGDCIMALSKAGMDSAEIKGEMQRLLQEYKLIKVRLVDPETKSVDLQAGKALTAKDLYMWDKEDTNYLSIFVAIGIVALILTLVMYQMWPVWMKRSIGYIRYPIFGFVGFLAVAGVVRIVVYGITYLSHPPGMWVLPNLFADCGFFESFVPAYSWANEDVSHKKEQ